MTKIKKYFLNVVNEAGVAGPMVLLFVLAIVGVSTYLLVSSIAPFKNGIFNAIFQKPSSFAATSISINGSARNQTIDGFGANVNPKNWSRYGGNLTPAIDYLADDLGSTLFRVDIFGMSNWETTNDDADSNNFNWTYYNQLYSTEYFNDLWSTIGYINNKPNARVILSASGVLPDWMGGQYVQDEDEWVEEVTSVVYYARNTRHLRIDYLDPLNETDLGPPEGPIVGPTQFAELLHRLIVRMDAIGLGDIHLVPPQVSDVTRGASYLNAMYADPLVMSRIDHFGFHNYNGQTSNIDTTIKTSSYPTKNFWMSEFSQNSTDGWLDGGAQVHDEWAFADIMQQSFLSLLSQGTSGALVWDGYDNVHDHNGSGLITHWGLLALNSSTGAYTPKPRFYTSKLVFKTVLPGFIRLTTGYEPDILAFYEPNSGRISIVGRNPSSSAQDYTFNLTNISTISSIFNYQTSSSVNFARQADIPVSNNTFTATIPAYTFFALTNVNIGGTITPTPPPSTGSPTPTASPTSTPNPGGLTLGNTTVGTQFDSDDSNYITGSRFTTGSSPATVSSMSVFVNNVDASPNNQYQVAIYTDSGGHPSTLVARSTSATLAAVGSTGAWNSVAISASLAANTNYWFVYNSNGRSSSVNNLSMRAGGQGAYTNNSTAFGTWTTPLATNATTTASQLYSIYANLGSGPSISPTSSPTVSPTPTASPSRTPSPTPSPSRSASPSPTQSPTASPSPSGTITVTFNDLNNPNRTFSGQYPTGVITWGSNWFLSAPWGQFTTNSFSFNGPSIGNASFTLIQPRRLTSLRALNGGTTSARVTLSCVGNSDSITNIAANTVVTINTNWINTCSSITFTTNNNWDTNFDDLVLQ